MHNGRDLRNWSGALLSRLPSSKVALTLKREGNTVSASGGAASGRLAGYWAVLKDGHSSRVKAGENAGKTLKRDHVVTAYKALDAWTAGDAAKTFSFDLPAATAAKRRVVFVVTDAASQRPVQALALAC